MSDLSCVLPPLTPDLGGAVSALWPLGGLVTFHDAAGCLENYVVYDEPRIRDSVSLVASSGLTAMDAITGNDDALIDAVVCELSKQSVHFAAVIGTPVPAVLAADMDGIAAEIETRSGIPCIAVNSSSFYPYWDGAGAALTGLLKKIDLPAGGHAKGVNLIGATPLDFSEAMLRRTGRLLEKAGWHVHAVLSAGSSWDDLPKLREAGLNLAVSSCGVSPCAYLKQKYGMPYVRLLPLIPEQAEQLGSAAGPSSPAALSPSEPENPAAADTLIVGEPVFAQSLAAALRLRRGWCCTVCSCAEPEREIAERCRSMRRVIGDPLYRPLCEKSTEFIGLPHFALSSHLFEAVDGAGILDGLLDSAAGPQSGLPSEFPVKSTV